MEEQTISKELKHIACNLLIANGTLDLIAEGIYSQYDNDKASDAIRLVKDYVSNNVSTALDDLIHMLDFGETKEVKYGTERKLRYGTI